MCHPPMLQEETLPRRWLLDAVPVLGTKDISTTIMRAAIAGLCRLIINLVSVVVGEFLTCLDIPDRYNPDSIPELFCVAVGITRMVDKARRVLARTPINGIALI